MNNAMQIKLKLRDLHKLIMESLQLKTMLLTKVNFKLLIRFQ